MGVSLHRLFNSFCVESPTLPKPKVLFNQLTHLVTWPNDCLLSVFARSQTFMLKCFFVSAPRADHVPFYGSRQLNNNFGVTIVALSDQINQFSVRMCIKSCPISTLFDFCNIPQLKQYNYFLWEVSLLAVMELSVRFSLLWMHIIYNFIGHNEHKWPWNPRRGYSLPHVSFKCAYGKASTT